MADALEDRTASRGSPNACLRRPHGRGEDERLPLWPDGPTIVGRTRHCDLRVKSRFLSRQHFAVLPTPRGYLLLDLDSRNGTFRNDRRTRIARLEEGDVIRAGSRILIFERTDEEAPVRCETCGRRMGPSGRSEGGGLCLACRIRFPRLGEVVADAKLTGAFAERDGLADYAAELERENRRLRVRFFVGGASRRALRGIASFSHPRAIAIHECVKHDGIVALVTDRPPPVSLALLTETGLPAPIGLVGRIMTDVASALAEAHRRGLRHGHLRPEYVGVAEDGHAVLDDLGLHDVLRPSDPETDWFVPPERRGGRRKAAPTDDVYAFGATYYQALTRKQPTPDYASGSVDATRPLASRRPDLPAHTAFVIGRALASDPKERYPGFDEILADLGRVRDSR
jgi:hypothetical protein